VPAKPAPGSRGATAPELLPRSGEGVVEDGSWLGGEERVEHARAGRQPDDAGMRDRAHDVDDDERLRRPHRGGGRLGDLDRGRAGVDPRQGDRRRGDDDEERGDDREATHRADGERSATSWLVRGRPHF
jgi:hypothetical protein